MKIIAGRKLNCCENTLSIGVKFEIHSNTFISKAINLAMKNVVFLSKTTTEDLWLYELSILMSL